MLCCCCSIVVYVGSSVSGQGESFGALELIRHPNYKEILRDNAAFPFFTLLNDIALIKLDRPINFDYVTTMPICLSDHLPHDSFQRCYTVGFGKHLPERCTYTFHSFHDFLVPYSHVHVCITIKPSQQWVDVFSSVSDWWLPTPEEDVAVQQWALCGNLRWWAGRTSVRSSVPTRLQPWHSRLCWSWKWHWWLVLCKPSTPFITYSSIAYHCLSFHFNFRRVTAEVRLRARMNTETG